MTIHFHSPLPPARTGVADYSAALLEELTTRAEVITNPADTTPGVDLYHIGNNAFHRDAYEQALARPGVVVLHDAVLQHFFLGFLDRAAYIDEFIYNYGDWYRDFAGELWDQRAKAPGDVRYFEWPMLRRIVERSLGVIVHNQAAAAAVRRHATDAKVAVIPHLFAPPNQPDSDEVARLRASWNADDQTTIVGIFGYLRETKRIPSIVRAFEKACARAAQLKLLVLGDFVSEGLEKSLRASLMQPGIIRRGYVTDSDFWLHAHAVDACVNLRVPSAGESSGIATRLMGIGKAVFLTEGPEVAQFPAGCYFPVSAGALEETELEEFLTLIAQRPEVAREMGQQARCHILREHAVVRVAERYLDFLRECG